MSTANVRIILTPHTATFDRAMRRMARAARVLERASLTPEERCRARRPAAYRRRSSGTVHTRSSRCRAGTRANRHRRMVPTFASDRGGAR